MLTLTSQTPRHPVSAAWGAHGPDEADALRESIEKHGFIAAYPIVLTDKPDGTTRVLDGWHRFKAAQTAGIPTNDLPVTDYTGPDPAGYVASLHRGVRIMTKTERARAVVKAAEAADGLRGPGRAGKGKTTEQLAQDAGVSKETIKKVRAERQPAEATRQPAEAATVRPPRPPRASSPKQPEEPEEWTPTRSAIEKLRKLQDDPEIPSINNFGRPYPDYAKAPFVKEWLSAEKMQQDGIDRATTKIRGKWEKEIAKLRDQQEKEIADATKQYLDKPFAPRESLRKTVSQYLESIGRKPNGRKKRKK